MFSACEIDAHMYYRNKFAQPNSNNEKSFWNMTIILLNATFREQMWKKWQKAKSNTYLAVTLDIGRFYSGKQYYICDQNPNHMLIKVPSFCFGPFSFFMYFEATILGQALALIEGFFINILPDIDFGKVFSHFLFLCSRFFSQ